MRESAPAEETAMQQYFSIVVAMLALTRVISTEIDIRTGNAACQSSRLQRRLKVAAAAYEGMLFGWLLSMPSEIQPYFLVYLGMTWLICRCLREAIPLTEEDYEGLIVASTLRCLTGDVLAPERAAILESYREFQHGRRTTPTLVLEFLQTPYVGATREKALTALNESATLYKMRVAPA